MLEEQTILTVASSAIVLGALVFFGQQVVHEDIMNGVFARERAIQRARDRSDDTRFCTMLTERASGPVTSQLVLMFLRTADPGGYAYLNSHPITVSWVGGDELARCENRRLDGPIHYSAYLIGTNHILLNRDALADDPSTAVAISHELVHVRYGDDGDRASHRSLPSRFWRSEEGDAHLRGLQTGEFLHLSEKILNPVLEYREFIYPLPLHGALFMAVLLIGYCMWWRAKILITRSREGSRAGR